MNSGVKSSGSSPLVRGQLGEVFGHIVGDRIIPARAGPTRAKSARIPIPSDHPRSCGANRFVRASFFIIRGSSPLVRGQPIRSGEFFYHSRIIPARAGPTYRSRPSSPRPSDHPRSCGANHLQRFRLLCALGSSPLVRGQRTGQSAFQRCVRIIPARAGPTVTQVDMDGVWPDHPRSCGANPMALVMRPGKPGSSPLVRGQPDGAGDASRQTRIIPARAGPTASLMLAKVEGTDHPRSCGANAYRASDDTGPCGSSPLVRGQLQLQQDDTTKLRIIPARAGPT